MHTHRTNHSPQVDSNGTTQEDISALEPVGAAEGVDTGGGAGGGGVVGGDGADGAVLVIVADEMVFEPATGDDDDDDTSGVLVNYYTRDLDDPIPLPSNYLHRRT